MNKVNGSQYTERSFRRILRQRETCQRTGLSWSSIRRLELKGEFPSRVKLSARTVGHYEDEVDDFIENLERVQVTGEI